MQVRASADGFSPQVHDLVVTSNDARDEFELVTIDSPADLSGVWTMTVSPSSICRVGFPDSARGRAYEVLFTQHVTRIQVRISGPTLDVLNDPNEGAIVGTRLRFVFVGDTEYGTWSYPDIFDRLSDGGRFGFDGAVEGTVTGSAIRATVNGDLVYWNAQTWVPTWYCRAKDQVVTMRR